MRSGQSKPFVLAALASIVGLVAAEVAPAQDQTPPAPVRFEYTPSTQDLPPGDHAYRGYGKEGDHSWTLSTSLAYDTNAFDQAITFAYNQFLVDDIEYLLEAGLWSFHDEGEQQAFGLSATLGFRWHFINRDRWTLFADMGIGLLGTTDTVPTGGTGFNFMPRVGVGLTHRLDDRTRLITGLRWHHISNARTRGDDRNPARDAPLLYVGLIVSF